MVVFVDPESYIALLELVGEGYYEEFSTVIIKKNYFGDDYEEGKTVSVNPYFVYDLDLPFDKERLFKDVFSDE